MKKISFVVPAYNEEKNIPKLYERLLKQMDQYKYDWELIFINDGSRDKTYEVLKDLAQRDRRVKYLDLSRNFGHQAALSAGLAHVGGDVIISMDCDLQDPPELVDQMIGKWEQGFEIVYARRMNFRKDNFLKSTLSQAYYKIMSKFSDVDIPRNVGDFRLVDRKVQDEINLMPERSRYLRGMVAWSGFRSTFVDYQRPDREEGESGYTFSKLLQLGMSGLLNFSNIPLRLGLYLGTLTIVLGMGMLSYQVFDTIVYDIYYHLYKWLVVVLFIFMGFLFILMWILGEYIGKIYDQVRQRPIFIIREKGNL